MTAVRQLAVDELDDWDARAVDAEGGHVLQSRAWAAHREATGWQARFHVVGDARALVLVRPWHGIGGGSAYVPRGPVVDGTPWATDADGVRVGESLTALAVHLSDGGTDVLAADPEVGDANATYRRALDGVGFHGIPEIQPSRHRMALPLPAGTDEQAVMDGIAKATRQRIRRAERDGVVVVRWDAATTELEGTVRATEDGADALRRVYGLLRATGDRRGFGFAGPEEFLPWWGRALEAGHLVYLEAREGSPDGDVLGGLVLYRHGRRLSTQHSGDRAERRRDHPGAMHLLRWRAIQLALAEGRTEMDLGGVDLPGARRIPTEGEPTFDPRDERGQHGDARPHARRGRDRCRRAHRAAAARRAPRPARRRRPPARGAAR